VLYGNPLYAALVSYQNDALLALDDDDPVQELAIADMVAVVAIKPIIKEETSFFMIILIFIQ